MNIYACYKNQEGKWVIDGEKGRMVYDGRWSRDIVMAAYQGNTRMYECGKYNIVVYEHDIRYSKGDAALVTIDKFDSEDNPLGSKHFYLRDGQDLSLDLTESDIDKIYNGKEGKWIEQEN